VADLTDDMQDAVEQKTFRPVVIAYLDILGDPIAMWTGNGDFAPSGGSDPVLNGKVYYRSESFASVSEIQQDEGIGAPVIVTLKANDLDESALRQVIRDKRRWLGRKAYIWLGVYDEDGKTVLSEPTRIKTGILAEAQISRSTGDVSLQFSIDSDLQNAKSAPLRYVEHQKIFEGDLFSSFIIELANKPSGFIRNGVGGGSGGDIYTPPSPDPWSPP
jgi:hypothetical protein